MNSKCFLFLTWLMIAGVVGQPQDAVAKRARRNSGSPFHLELKTAQWAQSIRPLPPRDLPDMLGGATVPRIDSSACSNFLRTVISTGRVEGYRRYSSHVRPLAEGVVVTPKEEIMFWRLELESFMDFSTVSNITFGLSSKTNVTASPEPWSPATGELRLPRAAELRAIELNPRWKALTRSVVPDKETTAKKIRELLTVGKPRSFPSYEESLYGIIRAEGDARSGTLAIASEGVLLTSRKDIYFWVLTKDDDLWLQDAEGRIAVLAREW